MSLVTYTICLLFWLQNLRHILQSNKKRSLPLPINLSEFIVITAANQD